jgi:hypothetical protein
LKEKIHLDAKSVLNFKYPTSSMTVRAKKGHFAETTTMEITTSMPAFHRDLKTYQQ